MGRIHGFSLYRFSAGALAATLVLCGASASARAADLTVATFNVESGDASPRVVAEMFDEVPDCDIWGLQEVQNSSWARIFKAKAEDVRGERFYYLLGTTGWANKLCIIYNRDRFDRIRVFELHDINPGHRFRSPLVAELEERSTGRRLLFMVNHLARNPASSRRSQARKLNAWVRRQSLPVIAVGDYNFDYDVHRLNASDAMSATGQVADAEVRRALCSSKRCRCEEASVPLCSRRASAPCFIR